MKQTSATTSIMGHPQVLPNHPPREGPFHLVVSSVVSCFSYRKRRAESKFSQDSVTGTTCRVSNHLADSRTALNHSTIRASTIASKRRENAPLCASPRIKFSFRRQSYPARPQSNTTFWATGKWATASFFGNFCCVAAEPKRAQRRGKERAIAYRRHPQTSSLPRCRDCTYAANR